MSRRVTAGGAAALVAVLLSACSVPVRIEPPESAPTPTAEPSASPAPSASPTPTPPVSEVPWAAGPGEVEPGIKRLAADAVETVGSWQDGASSVTDPVTRLGGLAVDPAAARALDRRLGTQDPTSRTWVVYPQYGGLTASRASVMVLARQELSGPQAQPRIVEHTLDVRLAKRDGAWRVTALAATPPIPTAPVSDLARRVLAEPAIGLPSAAVADIELGRIDDSVLRILLAIAREHAVDVTVLRSDHPEKVFGTDRRSNHNRGRAVDLWRVDGRLVVDPATPRSLLESVMRTAAAAGATEIGGPFDHNGPTGPGFFADSVHADHLHLGVTPGRRPARW